MPRLPRAFLSICVCALVCAKLCVSQEAHDDAASRAEYQRGGRTAKGENAADLLQRGYRPKMALREVARMQRAVAAYASTPGSGGKFDLYDVVWQSLGPSPMAYDPSGFSAYGNVTGRVTAIAVDQNDPSG